MIVSYTNQQVEIGPAQEKGDELELNADNKVEILHELSSNVNAIYDICCFYKIEPTRFIEMIRGNDIDKSTIEQIIRELQ